MKKYKGKIVGIILLVMCTGCMSSIPQCGSRTVTLQLPSGVPFFGNAPFEFKRGNDHVTCDDDE